MNQSVKPRCFLRFRLRTLLLLITLVAIWFGWKSHQAKKTREIVDSIQSDGYQFYYSLKKSAPREFADVTWYSNLMGGDSHADVVGVEGFYMPNLSAYRLRGLARMNSLESLRASWTEIDEESFKAVGEMSKLRILLLSTPEFPPQHLNHLTKLKNLEQLSISHPVGDEGLAILARMQSLESLKISSDNLTQDGIQQLSVLKNLKRLTLSGGLDASRETRQALNAVKIHDGSFRRGRSFAMPPMPVTIVIDKSKDQTLETDVGEGKSD